MKIFSIGSGSVGITTLDRFASYIASALITVIPADAVFTSARVEIIIKNRRIVFISIVIVLSSPHAVLYISTVATPAEPLSTAVE